MGGGLGENVLLQSTIGVNEKYLKYLKYIFL